MHVAEHTLTSSLHTGWRFVDVLIAMLVPTLFTFLSQHMSWTNIVGLFRTPGKNKATRVITYEKQLGYIDESRTRLLLDAIKMYTAKSKLDIQHGSIEVGCINDVPMQRNQYGILVPSRTADRLQAYHLNTVPVYSVWTKIDDVNVSFGKYTTVSQHSNATTSITESVTIESDTPEQCEQFCERVFSWYREKAIESEQCGRFLLMQSEKNKYDIYELSYSKTFDSIFFDDKPRLLSALDAFANKTGVYSVSGVQHRIGFLLHGPPGTGKTSLIKAIAHRLNRHVISINLAKVKTNHDLMTIMYGGKYQISDTESRTFSISQVVFVFEDVDAATKTVADRGGMSDDDSTTASTVSAESISSEIAKKIVSEIVDDKLNLAGILNAIDGIVDAPGRVLIMTTNYPDRLDRALVRPGRIDHRLFLGAMSRTSIVEMTRHFFGSIDEARLKPTRTYTPAELESALIVARSFDDFVETLV